MPTTPATGTPELPLFPLQAVLFPGGLLGLKVFEARYLDLMGRCLRERTPFGVVALNAGSEVRAREESVSMESVGTLAELMEVDSEQPGILTARCRGTERFEVLASRQQSDGLWLARTRPIAADPVLPPTAALEPAARALETAIVALAEQGAAPFLQPHRLDDAGWVANRWCEILPLALAARQRLMALPDPMMRLELVHEFLRTHGLLP